MISQKWDLPIAQCRRCSCHRISSGYGTDLHLEKEGSHGVTLRAEDAEISWEVVKTLARQLLTSAGGLSVAANGKKGKIAMKIIDISLGLIKGSMEEGKDLTRPYV